MTFSKFFSFFGFVILLWVLSVDASPNWIVKTLNSLRLANNIRRAEKIAKIAKKLGKFKGALPDDEIVKLAKIAKKKGGLDEVGKLLAIENFIGKYGDDIGHVVLQDAYLRIAVKNGKISSKFADDVFSTLAGTDGLSALVRKINSVSDVAAKGHLWELQIGNAACKRGFKVASFGQRFPDGLKHADTDLDILLTRGGKNFAIECKAYAGAVPSDMVKADAESLLVFCKEIPNSFPVFCFESIPSKVTTKFLNDRSITLIVGKSAEEVCSELDFLARLLAK